MSSGDQGTKQSSIEEYEKDYLVRLENGKKSENLQDTIFHMTKEIKKHETKDYVGFCVFCTIGVPREEMAYKNKFLFHSNCFESQGKNFPPVNEELQKQTSNAKVQLILLKNLKVRTSGTSNVPSPQSKPKKRSKPKRKTKKKSMAKRKQPARRKVKRKSKKRPAKKRRNTTKRRKSKRVSRRRPARRRSKPKTRRRTKPSSSRRRRR